MELSSQPPIVKEYLDGLDIDLNIQFDQILYKSFN